jgi:hypothetical protein
MQYDRSPLPHLDGLPSQSQRGPMGSSMLLIHRSPRPAMQSMQRQPSDLPMPPLPCPQQQQGERYSSPASSLNGRSPPRSDKYDINPLRQSPNGMDSSGGSPGRASLEVQDIPSEKLGGFGEDMRAIRVLDRAFAA